MFTITGALAERLRDELREHPLAPEEVRRIVGLGDHYLAATSTELGEHSLMRLCTLTVDGTAYVLARTDGSGFVT